MAGVELPTYTGIFSFERKLYAVYDWELPVPVSLFQGGVFLLAALVTVMLLGALGVGLSAATTCLYVVPPAGAAYLASQPVADAKRPHAFVLSQARYLIEPRTLNRLTPARPPRRMQLSGVVWRTGERG